MDSWTTWGEVFMVKGVTMRWRCITLVFARMPWAFVWKWETTEGIACPFRTRNQMQERPLSRCLQGLLSSRVCSSATHAWAMLCLAFFTKISISRLFLCDGESISPIQRGLVDRTIHTCTQSAHMSCMSPCWSWGSFLQQQLHWSFRGRLLLRRLRSNSEHIGILLLF